MRGEAEFAWPERVEDFRPGRLRKRVYQSGTLHDLKGLPRMDLPSLPLFRRELMRESLYRDGYFFMHDLFANLAFRRLQQAGPIRTFSETKKGGGKAPRPLN